MEHYIKGKRQKIIERGRKNINEVPYLFFCNLLSFKKMGKELPFLTFLMFLLIKAQ